MRGSVNWQETNEALVGQAPKPDTDRNNDQDPFERAKRGFFREGISTSRIYIREGQESVGAILIDMITGVQSAMTYAGVRTISELHERAEIGVQTAAGYGEGTPHGKLRR